MPVHVLSSTRPLTLATLATLLTDGQPVALDPNDAPPPAGPGATGPAPAVPAPASARLLAHACGTGAEVPAEVVRLTLLLHARQLPPTAAKKRLLDFYNREILPVVYQQGGDRAALAHLCLPLLGLGEVNYQGYRLSAADVLHLFSWQPVEVGEAETKALLTGAMLTLAFTAHGLLRLARLTRVAAELNPADAVAPADALAYLRQAVETLCNAPTAPKAAAFSLPLGVLRQTALRLGEQAAGRAMARLGAAGGRQPLRLLTADLQRQNRQLALIENPAELLSNAEQLLGLELLVAARVPGEAVPVVAAFREKLGSLAEQLPAVALRAAADFVRGYE